MVTRKTKQDGQKQDGKARLVARGFQENVDPPQVDSLMALRESNKMFYAIAANDGFDLRSMDIRAAFLKSNDLDRDVFVEPPGDVKKDGKIWKLVKPLYGLKDASRKFWLRLKEVFRAQGLKMIKGDEAFYYRHHDGSLDGMILTHVDDFSLAGMNEFLDSIEKAVSKSLTVSKVERHCYRFTGIDVKKMDDGIEINMEDYAESMVPFNSI